LGIAGAAIAGAAAAPHYAPQQQLCWYPHANGYYACGY
jgi:hypothetical protein